MRPLRVGGLGLLLLLGSAACVAAAPPKKIQAKLHVATVNARTRGSVEILYYDLAAKDQAAITAAVGTAASWSILVDDQLSTIRVQEATAAAGLISLTLTQPFDAETVAKHRISVLFAGDPTAGVAPESVDVKQPKPEAKLASRWMLPQFALTGDKKKANLDASGSLQTAVGATPLYQWSVLAQYPVEYLGTNYVFKAGPKFTGLASQQTNADPDSLSLRAAGEFDFPDAKLGSRPLPINLDFNAVDYEFERKAKQEAVLVNGKATLNPYQQKNTNLIVSGGVQFVEAWRYGKVNLPNVNLSLGTEFGSAVSRSVLNKNPKGGFSDNPLRAVAGADVYFDLPKVGSQPLLTVDGHYTVRSLFHPEPYSQEGVNGGNQFYATKARHFIAVNLARAIAKGANLTVQYKFGSLPPSFTFVDHQVTIGLEIVLGK